MLCVGLDTGVHTGFAVWDTEKKALIEVSTLKIHRAMSRVIELSNSNDIAVYFEDARLRKWYGNTGREKLQGAGSVKRDASIWEDFLKDLGVEYHAIAPKNNFTKVGADLFAKMTGYTGKTSEHGRDAAFLVINRK